MCYRTAHGWMALLNDFDLSAFVHDRESQYSTRKYRIGTAPYMARELLATAPEGVAVTHVYAHELESLFYLFLFITLGYTRYAPEHDVLKVWRSRHWEEIVEAKDAFFSSSKAIPDKLRYVRTPFCGHLPELKFTKVLKKHDVSEPFVFDAAILFADTASKCKSAVLTFARKNCGEVTEKEIWKLEHSILEETLTYGEYGTRVGVSVEDIAELSEEAEV
jgi:hypothetical protein